MVRGLEEGLLDDLWNFPSAFGAAPAEALGSLQEKLRRFTRAPFTLSEPVAEFRHGITYRSIQGQVYPVESARPLRHASLHWFELKELPQAAISQLARKIVHKIIGT
jgi:adenine-specific DNA glycosylase